MELYYLFISRLCAPGAHPGGWLSPGTSLIAAMFFESSLQSAGEWVCVYVFAHKLSVPVITRSASAPHALLYSTWLALDSEACCCQSRSKSHLCAKWKELCAPDVTSHRYKTVHVVCARFLLFSPLTELTFFSASWACEWWGAGLDTTIDWRLLIGIGF